MDTEFADLMEVGSLFHSFVAATVKVRSPALLRILGQERRKGSVLDRRFILRGTYNWRQLLMYFGAWLWNVLNTIHNILNITLSLTESQWRDPNRTEGSWRRSTLKIMRAAQFCNLCNLLNCTPGISVRRPLLYSSLIGTIHDFLLHDYKHP